MCPTTEIIPCVPDVISIFKFFIKMETLLWSIRKEDFKAAENSAAQIQICFFNQLTPGTERNPGRFDFLIIKVPGGGFHQQPQDARISSTRMNKRKWKTFLANAVRPYGVCGLPFMWDELGRRDEGIPPYGLGDGPEKAIITRQKEDHTLANAVRPY